MIGGEQGTLMVDVRIPEPEFDDPGAPRSPRTDASPRAYGAKLRRAAAAVAAATSTRAPSSPSRPPTLASRPRGASPITASDKESNPEEEEDSPSWEPSNFPADNHCYHQPNDLNDDDHHQHGHTTASDDGESPDDGSSRWSPPSTGHSAREIQLEEQLKQKDRQLKEAVERNAELESEAARRRSGSSDREEALEGELKRVQARLEELEAGRRSARSALAEMASQNARLVSAYAAKKEEVRGVRVELQRVQSASGEKVDALENKLKRSQEEVASLKESLHRERDRVARKQQYAPEEERERFFNERARWEAERAKLEAENHALRDQLDALRSQQNSSTPSPPTGSASKHRRSTSHSSASHNHSSSPAYQHHYSHRSHAKDKEKDRDRGRERGEKDREGDRDAQRDPSSFGPYVNSRCDFGSSGNGGGNTAASGDRRHSWTDGHGEAAFGTFSFASSSAQEGGSQSEQQQQQQQSNREPQSEAEHSKQEGNALFHSQKFEEAVEQYTAGMAKESAVGSVKAALHCNRAAAYQAQRMFIPAIADCYAALDIDSQYLRAIQRRADAFFSIGDYASASRDMEAIGASSLGPDGVARYEDAKRKSRRNLPVDYYAVLGVTSSASSAEIKGRYRQLALRHHPDKAAEQSDMLRTAADSLFKLINEAYACLSDPASKRKYDSTMLASRMRRQNSV